MNVIGSTTLTFARAGMELSWRYAWALYLIQLSGGRRPPLPGIVCVFLLAAALTKLMAGRNWRLYQKVLVQMVCFIISAILVVPQVLGQTSPLLSFEWIDQLLLDTTSIHSWFLLLLTLFCLVIVWQGGQALVKSSRRYYPLCIRFDKGMGLFFLLLITIAFIESRLGFHPLGRDFIYLAVAYLMFSLTAMSIARNESDAQKTFMTGRYGIGIILSTSILIPLLIAGTILFFYPYFSGVSDSLSTLIKGAAAPLDAALFTTLLFMLRTNERSQQSIDSATGSQKVATEDNTPLVTDMDIVPTEGGGLLQLLAGWSIFSLLGLIFIVALACFLIYIFRLLLIRTRDDTARPLPSGWAADFLRKLAALPMLLWNRLVSLLRRADCAALVFSQMLSWGRSSGIVMKQSETPSEYGSRLIKVFPFIMEEIQQIVDGFNREVYGQTAIDRESLSHLRSALRRMKGPRYWPMRMKMWFFQ